MIYQEYFLLTLQNIPHDTIYNYKRRIKTKIGLMLQKCTNTYENTKKLLQELLKKVINFNQKGENINFKETEYIIVYK